MAAKALPKHAAEQWLEDCVTHYTNALSNSDSHRYVTMQNAAN